MGRQKVLEEQPIAPCARCGKAPIVEHHAEPGGGVWRIGCKALARISHRWRSKLKTDQAMQVGKASAKRAAIEKWNWWQGYKGAESADLCHRV